MNTSITYRHTHDRVIVLLDRKHIGSIEKVTTGYAYCTADGRHWGDIFPTIDQVKRDIEAD